MGVLYGLIGYLALGAVLLLLFNLLTGRLSKNLPDSSSDAQQKLIMSGNYVNRKSAGILLLGSMWLLWPIVFIGALLPQRKDK
jgi:hypothetical protein